MSRILIAIATCHQYRVRAQAQRETWAHNLCDTHNKYNTHNVDLRFFLGGGEPKHSDEVILPVNDGYIGLPAKTKEICRWAREHKYTNLVKGDDDTYMQVDRLLASGGERHHYCGRLRGPSGIFPSPYCSGFCYWLDEVAMEIIANAPLRRDIPGEEADDAEDRWVANTLMAAGIWAEPDYRYKVVNSGRNSISGREAPRRGNDVIAACEFTPDQMKQVHDDWMTGKPSDLTMNSYCSGSLAKCCILVKTFLRDGMLFRCLKGLEALFPDSKFIIVDDGFEDRYKVAEYSRLRDLGHICTWLPYDSGFGAKGNAAIPYFDRQYVLIASDDFNFHDVRVRAGVERLVKVLDHDPTIDIASGRVNDNPYEALLEVEGDCVREVPGWRDTRSFEDITYHATDLCVNYSLIRSSCFGPDKLHWDGIEKIGGGEHGAFYVDAKRLGYGVAYVENVNIREYPYDFSMMHPMYPQARARARMPGRPCLKRRGINRWILQDGTAETT